MAVESTQIHIRKDGMKFSAAHMTVFPDGTKEALHGHNYRVELTAEVEKVPLERMIPFSVLKLPVKEICQGWDEKLLLAKDCPFFVITRHDAETLEFQLCGKRYALPADEVVLLPVDNITTEALAELFSAELRRRLSAALWQAGPLRALDVRIDEITGQGASYRWRPASGIKAEKRE